MLFHLRFDRLDHDDGVVDHDPDGQHHGQHRHRVQRHAEGQHEGECADKRNRNGDDRNDGGTPVAEEQEDHDGDKREGLVKRLLHLVHTVEHEDRTVGNDLHADTLRQGGTHLVEMLFHQRGSVHKVAARGKVNPDHGARATVEGGADAFQLRPQLDPCDIADPHDRAVVIGADDDLLEILGFGQPAHGLHVQLQDRVRIQRLRAHGPDGGLHVLRLQRADDIGRRQAKRGQLVDIEIHVHGELVQREDGGIAHIRDALDRIEKVDVGEVGQRLAGHPLCLAIEHHAHHQVGRPFQH